MVSLLDYPRQMALKETSLECLGFEGDYVECGVFQGGSAKILCLTMEGSPKKLHLFDKWDGRQEQFPCTLESVQKNLERWEDRTVFVRGDIIEKLDSLPEKIAFAHVDVDMYEPTIALLYALSTRITGKIIVDDYSPRWPGATKAVDESLNAGMYQIERIINGVHDDAIVLTI